MELERRERQTVVVRYDVDSRLCPRPEPRLVRLVKAYLAAHYSEPVSLDDLAAITGVTGFHLTRLFKSTTGLALHAWLVRLRVDRVREMLSSGMPASEAATACGFSDQPHMARWLRRLAGMTPREVQATSQTFKVGKVFLE
jgi:AraC-like DNA-binding protein